MFDVWKNILEEIKKDVSTEKFTTFLQKTTLISTDGGEIKIGVPNVFMQTNVRKNFDKNIREALVNHGIEVKSTDYVISDNNTNRINKKPREVSINEIKHNTQPKRTVVSNLTKMPAKTGLVPEYTFDNFVVGTNNDMAVYTAKAVIDDPGGKRNPFFLYGKSGVGKTHLIQAVGNELLKKNPNLKILYVPINHFYSDFIAAIRSRNPDSWRTKYENLDVLIIDDFQQITGKDKSQVEFFNLFNDMYLSRRQVIIASDRLPEEIKDVDVRLASRLTQNGAYDIQLPSFEDKCAILQAKAEFDGVNIEPEAIEYIAENVKTNIRDLNREYEQLLAFADLRGVTPLQIINSGYSGPSVATKKRTTTAKKIINQTAKLYEMDVKTMLSKSRVAHICNARQVAMYLMKNELGLSTTQIATELELKDHTTVMNGFRSIEKKMKMNFKLREDINMLRDKIYE